MANSNSNKKSSLIKNKKHEKLRVFEAFSGIGAQHKALSNLKKNQVLDFDLVGTSDWDVYSVQSYASIHHPNKKLNIKNVSLENLISFINTYSFSKNGKSPILVNKEKWIIFLNENYKILMLQFIKHKKDETKSFIKYPLLYKKINNFNFLELISWYHAFNVSNNIGSIVDSYERYKKYIYPFKPNLLTYSFPCQDLSTAGNFHGFNKGIAQGTRSGLLLEIEKLLDNLKKNKEELPKILVLENVMNLVGKQHKHSFDTWLNKLKKLGYSTYWGVLNSADFGMTQARRRVYAVSILDGQKVISNELDLLVKESVKSNHYKIKKQSIKRIVDFDNKYLDESLWAQIKDTPSRRRMIKASPILTPHSIKTPTITTKQDRLPNVGSIFFKNERWDKKGIPFTHYRFIQPRESYRLMGFDEKDYIRSKQNIIDAIKEANRIETATRDIMWKQAGNSIAVNVIEAIFYWINQFIGSKYE